MRKAKVAVNPSPESLLVDLKRASAILGLKLWTVRDLVWSKTIPAHHIGRKLFIKNSDLQAYVDGLIA
jgi:excisionase family DNA binding protein